MSPGSHVPVIKKTAILDLPGMAIGTLLRVQFIGIGSSQSCLVGMDPGHFLIIQTPPLINIASKRHEKNHIIISYLYSGRIYAFRCTLLLFVKEPYCFVILSYPEALDDINLRKHERISCIINAEVRVHEETYEGEILDISKGGCSFEFNRSDQRGFPNINVQDGLIISMRLNETGEATTFNTVLRAIKAKQESVICGLQFVTSGFSETDAESEKKLAEYLLTLQSS